MTPQKVSDILIRIIDEDWHVYTDDAINALKYAAKVVEKEIPKKPFKQNDYYCGNCNKIVFNTGFIYCPFCGQKFDWNLEVKDEGNR